MKNPGMTFVQKPHFYIVLKALSFIEVTNFFNKFELYPEGSLVCTTYVYTRAPWIVLYYKHKDSTVNQQKRSK